MIVVDCSVVVDALVGPDSERSSDVLKQGRVYAPMLLDNEVVSAVRGLVLGRHVGRHRGADLLDDYDSMPITRWRTAGDLQRRAYELRDNISAYDAAYVALAESLDFPLVTRDKRLAKAASSLIDVVVV